MTSTARVSDFKPGGSGKKKNPDGMPRAGTAIREAYDALRRGELVKLSQLDVQHAQLRDFYGMDLEMVREGRKALGARLIGEWDGPYYVPFERIVQEEAA